MVLKRHTGFEIEDHFSVGGYDAVLYLAPKGWTIKEWCDEEQRRTDAEFAAQLASVTAE
jgi:hypothetical protein